MRSLIWRAVGQFVGVQDSVVEIREVVLRVVLVIVVFFVVEGVMWTPFDDEAGGLYPGLLFVECNLFDACNGGVGHRDGRPLVTRDFASGDQGEKEEIALMVSSGREGDGTRGAGAKSAGSGVAGLVNLCIRAKFDAQLQKIRVWLTGENGMRAKGV